MARAGLELVTFRSRSRRFPSTPHSLLNANSYDASLMCKFNKVLYCNDIIPSSLISEAIKKLECGKSASPDGVYAESIKFAHPRLHILLSISFS